MKNLLLIFFSFCSILQLQAKCGGSGIIVEYPSHNDEISTQATVILKAFGGSRYSLKQFGNSYPVYLVSQNDKVKLIQEELHHGDFNWSQALFRTERALKEGDSYKLVFEKISTKMKASIYGNKVSWKAIKNSKINKISLTKKIKYIDGGWTKMGCGPAVYSNYAIDDNIDKPIVVAVEIENITTGEISCFNVITKNGKISVGHGMCSGPFVYKQNDDYKIRFKNNMHKKNKTWTNWLPCNNPW